MDPAAHPGERGHGTDIGFRPAWFRACPVVAILRGYDEATTLRLVEAARSGGLRNVEVTMDTPGAERTIGRVVAEHGGAMNVGAGTVTTLERLASARRAGATFVVTPALSRPVLAAARAAGLPVFPGAMTPTEVFTAWEWGASLVKVFPTEGLGRRHIEALGEALPGVGLLPTGGVALEDVPAFVSAGASGFGVGSPLFRKDRVEAGDWAWIESRCRAWSEAVGRCLGDRVEPAARDLP